MTTSEMYAALMQRLDAMEAKSAEQFAELNAKLEAKQPEPQPVVSSIWGPLSVDDPLADYEQTADGWISLPWRSTDFPGDQAMLMACWVGVEPPTGRVMHAGNLAEMKAKRAFALNFHSIDLRGDWGATDWAKANVGPNPAACLLLLGMNRVVGSNMLGSDSQFGPGSWNNVTDMAALFLKLKSLSEGTGGPSGGQ